MMFIRPHIEHTMIVKTLGCDFTTILGYLYCFLKCLSQLPTMRGVRLSMHDGLMYNKQPNL